MRLIDVNPRLDPRWEAFVRAQPDGLVYHHPLWLEVIQRAYGHEPACLACEDQDGVLQGILPMFHTHGWLTGQRFSSLPHTPVGGPLVRDAEAVAVLMREAMSRVDRTPGSLLEIRLPAGSRDVDVGPIAAVPGEMTFVLELPRRIEHLRFGGSRNRNRLACSARNAGKRHIEIRIADSPEDLRVWHGLYLETMRRHAVPPRPWRFFEAIWDLLRPAGLMRLLLAEQRLERVTRPVAGSMWLMSGRTIFYAFNGWCRQRGSDHANDALQWQAIHDACREGYERYDFGEVDDHNPGLAGFKSKWGATAVRLQRCYYPAPGRAEALARSPARGRIMQSAWRSLPLTVTALLGDRLYGRF